MRRKLIWFGVFLSFAPTQAPAQSTSPYVVDGLALGERVHFGTAIYNTYECRPSDQFTGFTWCQRKAQERRGKKEIASTSSILHGSDGATAYVNRSIRPAFLNEREAVSEINRLSAKFGENAQVSTVPNRRDLAKAVIAVWGKVELEPLDVDAISVLAAGESPRTGLLIDFLGDLKQSAKLDLPVYRLTGGAGYVWSASFDEKGIGHLRFLAVDASAISESRTEVAGYDGSEANEAPAPNQPEQGAPPSQEESIPSGSGFAVTDDGLILTNRHVVQDCKSVSVGNFGSAAIKAVDVQNDFALLKVAGRTSAAKFRYTPMGLGETVYVVGFPFGGILGAGMNFTSGAISSLSGIKNDSRYLQFTAPVQPGNSGGPMVDANGLVTGVVSGRLDDIEVLKASGSLPQNVNFAIRGDLALGFLRANGVEPLNGNPTAASSVTEVAKNAQSFTVAVLCAGATTTATAAKSDRSNAQVENPPPSSGPHWAVTAASEFFRTWSLGNSEALAFLDRSYPPQTYYYGELSTKAAVMKAKEEFAKRWPKRDYSIRPGSLNTSCDTASCLVWGVVDWRAYSPERGVSSAGSAKFELRFAHADRLLVLSETGQVLNRQLEKDRE